MEKCRISALFSVKTAFLAFPCVKTDGRGYNEQAALRQKRWKMTLLEVFSERFMTPSGSLRTGERISLKLGCPEGTGSVSFAIKPDGGDELPELQLEKNGDVFTGGISIEKKGLYFFTFRSDKGYLRFSEGGELYTADSPEWAQLTVYDRDYVPASSFAGGTAYQIFPDRFASSGEIPRLEGRVYHSDLHDMPVWRPNAQGKIVNNDFYGGNLRGIAEKLPYLEKLGVTLIYLNPIFRAYSNHRYDTGDYMEIDPQLGTEEDLRNLCSEARGHGIRIILDGVFSHTGDDSRYFNRYGTYDSLGAFQSRESPYADWYKFEKWPDRYHGWWGISTLPEVNETEPSYTEFITGENGVISKWMKTGVSGFRLDVADELPDEFIEKVRTAIKREDPDGLLIGEVWEDASNKISYSQRRKYFLGTELDGTMNYPFRTAVLDFIRNPDAGLFRSRIEEIVKHYPDEMLSVCLNNLSSHDTDRAISALAAPDGVGRDREYQAARKLTTDEYFRGVEMLKLAYALLFFLPGIPTVYYGDEIGMSGYRDPFCRGYFTYDTGDRKLLDSVTVISAERKKRREQLSTSQTEFFMSSGSAVGFIRGRKTGKRTAFLINRGDSAVKCTLPDGQEISAGPWRWSIVDLA